MPGIEPAGEAMSDIPASQASRHPVANMLPGLKALWRQTQGHPEIKVAVLDGPVDLSHPCFEGASLRTLPTLARSTSDSDHGTHIASLLFGQPETVVEGIAPRCTGLIVPVFGQGPNGRLKACSQQTLAHGIAQAIEEGANVINISGGELSSQGHAIDFLNKVVRQAAERNVLIVAAAGNQGCECLNVPAALPSVLPIGALDQGGRPLDSSNWSDGLDGIMAPGALIEGAVPGGDVEWMTGTSFATPLVSGIAALLLSALKERGLPADAVTVRAALIAGAKPCDPSRTTNCRRLLKGVLDIAGSTRRLFDVSSTGHVIDSFPSAAATRHAATPSPFEYPITSVKGVSMSESIEPSVLPPVNRAEITTVTPAEAIEPGGATQVTPACASTDVAQTSSPDLGTAGEAVQAAEIETEGGALIPTPVTARQVRPATGGASTQMNFESRAMVEPSCQGSSMFSPFPPGQKAFPLGKLYYDFGTEARRDYFIAQIRSDFEEEGIGDKFNQGLVYNPEVMVKYLFNLKQDDDLPEVPRPNPALNNTDAANALIWTLYIDQDPVYALVPEDQYAVVSFVRLANFLSDQVASVDPETFRVAAAGTINGSVTLFNGTVVPKLSLITRGMYDWDIEALIDVGTSGADDTQSDVSQDLKDFLLRIYDQLRNLGVMADDRARNFAATNAYQARQAFVWANSDGRSYKLDGIRASKSPICRRNSDCWDISLTFFDPENLFQAARQVFEYTIDVSDIIPVQVGDPRVFPIYGGPSS